MVPFQMCKLSNALIQSSLLPKMWYLTCILWMGLWTVFIHSDFWKCSRAQWGVHRRDRITRAQKSQASNVDFTGFVFCAQRFLQIPGSFWKTCSADAMFYFIEHYSETIYRHIFFQFGKLLSVLTSEKHVGSNIISWSSTCLILLALTIYYIWYYLLWMSGGFWTQQ